MAGRVAQMAEHRTGAGPLVSTLLENGVDICFANPGRLNTVTAPGAQILPHSLASPEVLWTSARCLCYHLRYA